MNNKQLKELYERGEISREVFEHMKKSNRKMRYDTYDLKTERITNAGTLPAREDIYDRLLETGKEFDTGESVEDIVIKALLLEKLHDAIERLEPGEKRLIFDLYYSRGGKGQTEREVAKGLGVANSTLHDRKEKILDKLKKIMDL